MYSPALWLLRFKLCHIMRKNRTSDFHPRVQAWREHVETGSDMCDMIPASQMGCSLCCIIKGQPEVVPTIFSLTWLISNSLFTLQPVYISKSCSHQSMTPSPYEEIRDQLALIRAVSVSSIISISLLLCAICTEMSVCA